MNRVIALAFSIGAAVFFLTQSTAHQIEESMCMIIIGLIDVFALEQSSAHVEQLKESLANVLAILKRDGGFRTPVQQATIRGARALLVELGEAVNREDV